MNTKKTALIIAVAVLGCFAFATAQTPTKTAPKTKMTKGKMAPKSKMGKMSKSKVSKTPKMKTVKVAPKAK